MPIFDHIPDALGLRRETTPEPTQLAITFLGGLLTIILLYSAYDLLNPKAPEHKEEPPFEQTPAPDPKGAAICHLAAGGTIYITRAVSRWVEAPIHPYGTSDINSK
ncbi:MAG: hypothetical protein ACKVQS_13965 [Fimbriimonadaceae bacterium]